METDHTYTLILAVLVAIIGQRVAERIKVFDGTQSLTTLIIYPFFPIMGRKVSTNNTILYYPTLCLILILVSLYHFLFLILSASDDYWIYILCISILILISICDYTSYIIPETLTWACLFGGLLYSPLELNVELRILGAIYAGFILWIAFTAHSIITRNDHYSGGDVALACGCGAWVGVDNIAPLFVLLITSALIFGLVKYLTSKTRILPMGPCFMVATLGVFLWKV